MQVVHGIGAKMSPESFTQTGAQLRNLSKKLAETGRFGVDLKCVLVHSLHAITLHRVARILRGCG